MIQMLSRERGAAETRRLAFEALRRAEAMGLLEGADIGRFDARAVRPCPAGPEGRHRAHAGPGLRQRRAA